MTSSGTETGIGTGTGTAGDPCEEDEVMVDGECEPLDVEDEDGEEDEFDEGDL